MLIFRYINAILYQSSKTELWFEPAFPKWKRRSQKKPDWCFNNQVMTLAAVLGLSVGM